MELKEQLTALEENIKADNKEMIEKALDGLVSNEKLNDSSEEIKSFVKQAIEAGDEALTKKFNDFSAKLSEKQANKLNEGRGFNEKFKDFIADNMQSLGKVTKGQGAQFGPQEMKAVADMLTTGDHVTGDYIRDYNRVVVDFPGQALNVSDLVPSVQIDGGTYTYIRETAGEGAPAAQTEGSQKPKVDSDYSHIDVTTDFIAGITIYSRKMRNNLQYLQSHLPGSLRRKYFIAENTAFNTTLAAAATTSTNLIANSDNIAELIIKDMADLDAANYNQTNGVVMNTANYYDILFTEKSTGAGYGLPFGFTYDAQSGLMRCLGVPVFKANWVAATKYYVGDWSMIERVVTEGLSFEVSDQQYFDQNDIVARIEAQVALAVKQPASLIIGDTDAV